ncbi:MAG: protoporphyrinogen oxidase [Acidimicrobiales bacterium]
MSAIAVVGGGISGLAAAWELSADAGTEVIVYEAADRVGGKIHTSAFAGRQVDEGADAFLRRVPDALALCAEIGLDDLVSPATGSAFLWIDGQLRRLPGGLVLGVPARFDELEASGILSHWGLARAMHEPDLDGEPLVGDCTIGSLISRRYGTEVTERLVGPLLGGINAGAIDEMSLDAVVPQLAAVAHRSASLSVGLAETLPPPGTAATEPVFSAPVGGMGVLVDRLHDALLARGVRFELGRPLDELPTAGGVVVTVPADVAARLLAPRSAAAAAALGAIEFASVVFTTIAYRADDVGVPLDGSGFLAPRDSGLSITAVSWASAKWAHLAGDPVVLRVSMGHAGEDGAAAAIDLDDDAVLAAVRADLATTMGITAAPVEHRITRYRNGFPQYEVGHLDRVDRLEADLLADAPDLAVCGMAHRGVGIPACIREARHAARALADRLAGAAR